MIILEGQYKRMRKLVCELPRPDAAGNVPAVEFARATLARKLIRDRRRVGLTQGDLAHRTGVKLELLSRIEKGKRMPDTATFNRIHRALERAERQAHHNNH